MPKRTAKHTAPQPQPVHLHLVYLDGPTTQRVAELSRGFCADGSCADGEVGLFLGYVIQEYVKGVDRSEARPRRAKR